MEGAVNLARGATELDRHAVGPDALDGEAVGGKPAGDGRNIGLRWPEALAGLLGTYSGVITLPEDQREQFSRRVRAFLDRQPWDQVDLPMICRCLKSTRLPG